MSCPATRQRSGAQGSRDSRAAGPDGTSVAIACTTERCYRGVRSPASATNASSAPGSSSESRLATRSEDSPRRIRLTGASSFLPVSVRGIAGTETIVSGTWRGDSSLRSASRSVAQRVVELGAVRRDDEQQQLAGTAAGILEMHHQSVYDLGDIFDDRVELAGAEANAAAVQRRVGAAGDDAAAALGELDPIALAPDPGVDVEVRGAVALAVLVSPERHGHRRHRLGDHELAELTDQIVAVGIERVRIDAQARAGDLALVHRLGEAARHEPGAHVGAARPVVQQHLRPELLVGVQVALRGQRRPRRAQHPNAREVALAPGLDPGLAACHQVRGRHAHHGRPELLGEAPLLEQVGPGRVAVEHHDRGAQLEPGDERVPHHPRCGREPQQPAARL